ncbi:MULTISPECIES: hypothetical protein [Bacillus]|uniref:Uncharacterized protein n=1 Tax=Bacillus subtilis TaxID=1423 RepID=A0AAQ3IHY7_BACIU|nr:MULTISPECIES: hypothetical protein [Bacillus]KIN34405.1 hypothetical protein B4071_2101 [Bacillus subtilis]MBO3767112.1 hypothetical protein [Bacillus subtilis]MDP8528063.1 hypothetical protein [Bacillus subtilis]ODV46627.1 hypothetical protein BCM26_14755 [Bacillus subtilis]OJH62467.1 hypothetical protein BOH71_15535 [Bacillus subtilis]
MNFSKYFQDVDSAIKTVNLGVGSYVKLSDEIAVVSELSRPYINAYEQIGKIVDNLTFPDYSFPNIQFPTPDFSNVEELTKNNSKYGWTVTDETSIEFYFSDKLIGMNQKEMDRAFVEHLEANDYENLNRIKSCIISTIEKNVKGLMLQCFKCYEMGLYASIIPTLMILIESEISAIAKSSKINWQLLRDFKKESPKLDEDYLAAVALYSLNRFLKNQLYKDSKFYEKRPAIINRHWVLHGRDDPTNWTKADALRLINVLGTIQMLKSL